MSARLSLATVVCVALSVSATASDTLSRTYNEPPRSVFAAALSLARRSFLNNVPNNRSNEIAVSGELTGQKFTGRIVCQPAGEGKTLVSVVTELTDPPREPAHVAAPQENGRAAQKRADENALLTNLRNSIAYRMRLVAGVRAATAFLNSLQKELAAARRLEASSASEPLTNDSVVRMVKGGLGDQIIATEIARSPCLFALGPIDLIHLKDEGVSARVIEAMLAKK